MCREGGARLKLTKAAALDRPNRKFQTIMRLIGKDPPHDARERMKLEKALGADRMSKDKRVRILESSFQIFMNTMPFSMLRRTVSEFSCLGD
jgi:hypothetical protein